MTCEWYKFFFWLSLLEGLAVLPGELWIMKSNGYVDRSSVLLVNLYLIPLLTSKVEEIENPCSVL